MTDKQLKKILLPLLTAFEKIPNKDDMFLFLRDLCTDAELLEMNQRLDIAQRLHTWESYKKIEETTWASSTTIARVAKFLWWEFGWYKLVLEK